MSNSLFNLKLRYEVRFEHYDCNHRHLSLAAAKKCRERYKEDGEIYEIDPNYTPPRFTKVDEPKHNPVVIDIRDIPTRK